MQIIKEQKAGIIGELQGQPIRQYDDSITVLFRDNEERINNKVITHKGIKYYFGCSNRQQDGTYIATMWKTRPVY